MDEVNNDLSFNKAYVVMKVELILGINETLSSF